MKLAELLKHIEYRRIIGPADKKIVEIEFDSRKVVPGSAFVAQRGVHADGHRFIQSALEKGAVAVFCEEIQDNHNENATFIQVDDSNRILGELASAFYGFPSARMKVVGVTGTNGKTSIATLLHRLFRNLGYNAGLISTISYKINETSEVASHTTPDALKIQRLLAKMAESGCAYCFFICRITGVFTLQFPSCPYIFRRDRNPIYRAEYRSYLHHRSLPIQGYHIPDPDHTSGRACHPLAGRGISHLSTDGKRKFCQGR
ncbi:MAG: hypothetical protein EOM73_14140 [Bacteroidia bacterium]|nr:hypothetical protein [Bacteroidia bacterium]